MIDQDLIRYATPAQARMLQATIDHGSDMAAAEALGCRVGSISTARSRARRAAAERGVSPEHGWTHEQPEDAIVVGVSTMVKTADGLPQWVKTRLRPESVAAAWQAAAERSAELMPWADEQPAPVATDDELLTVYGFGDPHFGMFAWAAETCDADYDLAIAKGLHIRAMRYLARQVPPSRDALILSVGDLAHADNPRNQTSRSGHALDVDTRYFRMVDTILQTAIAQIEIALRRHAFVRVVLLPGNHDDITSPWVATCLRHRYHAESRVDVWDGHGGRFFYHDHGQQITLGATHGDTVRPLTKLQGIMDVRDQGRGRISRWRHWYTGHIHQDKRIPLESCAVEVLPTLAPLDAYAAAAGYRSARSARADVWHQDGGRLQQHYAPVEILG